MKRSASAIAVIPAAWLALTLVTPTPISAAAMDTADASTGDAVTTLEMHTTANCVKAEANCYFTAGANLRAPDGPIGFPDDLWARQTTTVRTMDKTVFLETDFDARNTRMFKSVGPIQFTTIYFGGGPVEKYQIHGNSRPVDWGTGQPRTDRDYIVCAHIQVVYSGVNLTSPDACAQTTFG
jgi:hypothetical protein